MDFDIKGTWHRVWQYEKYWKWQFSPHILPMAPKPFWWRIGHTKGPAHHEKVQLFENMGPPYIWTFSWYLVLKFIFIFHIVTPWICVGYIFYYLLEWNYLVIPYRVYWELKWQMYSQSHQAIPQSPILRLAHFPS